MINANLKFQKYILSIHWFPDASQILNKLSVVFQIVTFMGLFREFILPISNMCTIYQL
jgi:hypothetical protein